MNSSLSSMGSVKGGPETFIEALKEYITSKGLIVMSTYPHINMYNYLENYEIFDVKKTPSKNGSITEIFRKGHDVIRSLHPTHSLAAWGKDAKYFMEGHEISQSPYDEFSPYKKLLDINVKMLLIGVNFNHAVMIRVIDDLYPDYPLSPYIPNKVYTVEVRNYDGNLIKINTPCHDPIFSKERNNMAIFPHVKDKVTFGKLGSAYTWVLRSQDLFNKQIDLSKKGVFPFYKLPLKNRL
ncbi:MAG: AAC(3) family N-acetyltransferase [Bacteroidales bacterium]